MSTYQEFIENKLQFSGMTAAPNDYIELGTSSEALGELGYTDMLTRFFKNDESSIEPMSFYGGKHTCSRAACGASR